ncbi:MAG: glycosyltransferase [Gemmatimonadaceae bacterium]
MACSARNAGAWIDGFLLSLVAQSHSDWELWIRDDGSTDDTAGQLEQWRAREPRVKHVLHGDHSIGAAQGFADVLRRLPADAQVIATGDADDVWMPERLAAGLSALERAEETSPGPILIHSDLLVVDEALQDLASSFWRSEGIDPYESSLPSLAIQNVAVGPTLLFNAALLSEVREIPEEAVFQDWWIALVAAATGRVVALSEPLVLYRQHGANAVGARRGSILARLPGAMARGTKVRRDLDATSLQARALLTKYGSRLAAGDCEALQGLASIAELSGWRRKVAIARWRWLPSHGVLRNIGILVRG